MSQLVQFGASESAFCESIGGFRACFASQLVFSSGFQSAFSQVNWFQFGASDAFCESIGSVSGLQSTFRESFVVSFDSVRGFQSAFRESIGSVRASERVSRVSWFSSGLPERVT